MSIDDIVALVSSLDGTLVLAPTEGSGFPELAWGDHFFYYAPDGKVPTTTQPFATVVTKDYPDDDVSRLDGPGRWRVNIDVGRARFAALTGHAVGEHVTVDHARPDVVLPHPVYGRLGWIALVTPGPASATLVDELVRAAHSRARERWNRRRDVTA